MYDYRKLSRDAQHRLLTERRMEGQPLHNVAHRMNESNLYLLTGACFEHQCVMDTPSRRDEFAFKLLSRLEALPESEIFAWCVLPDHFHLLAKVNLLDFSQMIARLYNGTSTQWNREDGTPGRKNWFSFCDRDIRNDRHFAVAMNYIHANSVKHRWAKNAFDWPWSSLHDYAEKYGKKALQQMWRDFPVRDFGAKWD